MQPITSNLKPAIKAILLLLLVSCARMGSPDGGWYDETPPHVVGTSPQDKGTDVKSRRVSIYFNEYIKIDNATEKVVVSPPQMEMPEIKTRGKYITVQLLDSLKENTTYTIDFSDAISDNNEGNPMGNYTFSFSTGEAIDTLEVAGTVLNAEDLEPIKGILVGLFPAEDGLGAADSLAVDSLGAQADSLGVQGDMGRAGTTGMAGDALPTDTLQGQQRVDSIASPVFIRVSRTDSRGRFVIKGVAPGCYTVGALQDMDNNYTFNSLSEVMAFSNEKVRPSVFVDVRQDTAWVDELHIKDISRVKYNHFLPDDIVLRAFAHKINDRYYLKAERTDPEKFTLFFTAPVEDDSLTMARLGTDYASVRLPRLKGLNFDSEGAFVVEPSLKGDTVTYWLRDTALVNQDTLRIEIQTLTTDTLKQLSMWTDTLEVMPKVAYEKRMKLKANEAEEWQKKLEKRRKRLQDGEELTDTVMPEPRLVPKFDFQQTITPDGTLNILFPYPMKRVDREAVHLYVEQDSLWYRAPFRFRPVRQKGEIVADSLPRQWEIVSEWIPGAEYSLEIDTLAFEDIYGKTSEPYKTGLKIRRPEEFGSLFVNVIYNDRTPAAARKRQAATPDILVQLLDSGDKPKRTEKVVNGTAEFYYLSGGTYYMRAIIDRNGNGQWDTGDYLQGIQPEEVYYYNGTVEAKAKWDLTKEWDLTRLPLDRQKPDAITKQKPDAEKKIQNRNAKRAADKGIAVP